MTGWTEEGLIRAWKALVHQQSSEVWRFVHLTRIGDVSVEAGCHFPVGREALIVSFPGNQPVNLKHLPEGKGFDVSHIKGQGAFPERTVIALVRKAAGPGDIFAVMVVDVLRTLGTTYGAAHSELMDVYLERVREWQAFMERSRRPLSSDAQVGLMGELWMLRLLTDTSLGPAALESWQGPVRAAQDFHVREGAIEVKSTVRTGPFLARINSIEQLDGDRSPTFLCAFRFEENADGTSLPAIVSSLRSKFADAGIHRAFEALLMVMGYLDEHESLYGRRLVLKETRTFLSEGDMPRLTRATLPTAVTSVAYVLNVDALDTPSIGLSEVKKALGV